LKLYHKWGPIVRVLNDLILWQQMLLKTTFVALSLILRRCNNSRMLSRTYIGLNSSWVCSSCSYYSTVWCHSKTLRWQWCAMLDGLSQLICHSGVGILFSKMYICWFVFHNIYHVPSCIQGIDANCNICGRRAWGQEEEHRHFLYRHKNLVVKSNKDQVSEWCVL